jgi:hypothetical protein
MIRPDLETADPSSLIRLADYFQHEADRLRALAHDATARLHANDARKARRENRRAFLLKLGEAISLGQITVEGVKAQHNAGVDMVAMALKLYRREKISAQVRARDVGIWKAYTAGKPARILSRENALTVRRVLQIVAKLQFEFERIA